MDAEQPGAHNNVGGSAENVFQGRDVHGGVHFHLNGHQQGNVYRVVVPEQLPNAVSMLVNQVRVRKEFAARLTGRSAGGRPAVIVLGGPGGTGKTTVAVHELRECIADFPDGQLCANLSGGSDELGRTTEVLGEFLSSLGVPRSEIPSELGGRSAMFRSLTTGRSLQILLDDVVGPAQVRPLLPGPGGSLVVITGNGDFGILKHEAGAGLIDLDPLERSAAIELLGRFAGDRLAAESEAVDIVLARCDGLPIALCVVGAMLADDPQLTVTELVAELTADRPLAFLRGAGGRSVSTVFDAAYRRLSPAAQACYRALGLHPGTDELNADALAAAIDLPDDETAVGLRELRRRRIVEQPMTGRYVVHNLVRAHARQLAEATDSPTIQEAIERRFLHWYLRGAVAADGKLMPQRPWRDRLFPQLPVEALYEDVTAAGAWLEAERGTLRAVVELAARHENDQVVCQLAMALWSLYEPGKYFDDLIATNTRGVDAARRMGDPALESLLLSQLAFPYHQRGQADEAYRVAESALEPAHRSGHAELVATAVEGMGLARIAQGRRAEAVDLLRENLELAEQIGDPRRSALARFHLAKVAPAAEAVGLLNEAEGGFQGLPERETVNLSKISRLRGQRRTELDEREPAHEDLRRALDTMQGLKRPYDRAEVLLALGDWAVRYGPIKEAGEHYQAALALAEEHLLLRLADQARARLAALGPSAS